MPDRALSRRQSSTRGACAQRCAIVCSTIVLVSAVAEAGCRKRRGEEVPAAPPSSAAASATTDSSVLRFERFIAVRARDDRSLEVAGVTRDNEVVLADLDPSLAIRGHRNLARRFVATEQTSIALARGGVVVVIGRIDDTSGVWLLREGTERRAIGPEWCTTSDGIAWLVRGKGSARVHFVRGDPSPAEVTSGEIAIPNDSETHLRCGPDGMVVSVGDGEHLALARVRPGSPSFATPTSVEVEKEDDARDELRERLVLPRAGEGVVVLRFGASSVMLREVKGGEGPSAWNPFPALRGKAGLRLDEETDVVDGIASPIARGPVWVLASEVIRGAPCTGGELPRRIVLWSFRDEKGKAAANSRPMVELACGVEAISAHLTVEGGTAHFWWTEPIADGRCAFPGLAVGAIVEASGDRPGTRRAPLIAEDVARVGEGRYVAVVRTGGCAPYDTPANGALAWAPTPK